MSEERERLCTENLNLIYHVLQQMGLYNKCDLYYDVGVIGLVKASKVYDENKGVKFITYASRCIRNEICREIITQNYIKRKANLNTLSLDSYTKSENMAFKDLIDSEIDIENETIKKEYKKMLYENISKLNTREQFIILNYYGMLEKSLNIQEISQRLSITESTVYGIKRRALKKLKKLLENTKGWNYEK